LDAHRFRPHEQRAFQRLHTGQTQQECLRRVLRHWIFTCKHASSVREVDRFWAAAWEVRASRRAIASRKHARNLGASLPTDGRFSMLFAESSRPSLREHGIKRHGRRQAVAARCCCSARFSASNPRSLQEIQLQ
jgi:hypothetical protein